MDRAQIAKKEILDMGLDDYTGLYEILWRFNTLWPEMDIGEKYQLADEALRGLLDQEAVRIIKQTSDQDQPHYEAIDQTQMDQILRSPASWYSSTSDGLWSQLGYETTDVGEVLHNDFYSRRGA